jgi:hypothetical protein
VINNDQNPVQWAMLGYGLDDARKHLEALIDKMSSGAIDETDFAIDLGHIYAHLNRTWNKRSDVDGIADFAAASEFPTDLRPVG